MPQNRIQDIHPIHRSIATRMHRNDHTMPQKRVCVVDSGTNGLNDNSDVPSTVFEEVYWEQGLFQRHQRFVLEETDCEERAYRYSGNGVGGFPRIDGATPQEDHWEEQKA